MSDQMSFNLTLRFHHDTLWTDWTSSTFSLPTLPMMSSQAEPPRVLPTALPAVWRAWSTTSRPLSRETTAVTTTRTPLTVAQTQTPSSDQMASHVTDVMPTMKLSPTSKTMPLTAPRTPVHSVSSYKKFFPALPYQSKLQMYKPFLDEEQQSFCCGLHQDGHTSVDYCPPGIARSGNKKNAYDRLSQVPSLKWRQICTGTRKW